MSEPNKIRKWVVEKFDGISPGLIFRSDHLEAILKAVFPVQRQKTFKPSYLKTTFSTYFTISQNTAEVLP